jgi:hypothetical protein
VVDVGLLRAHDAVLGGLAGLDLFEEHAGAELHPIAAELARIDDLRP